MKEKDYCIYGKQEVSSNSKGRRMQMNVLHTWEIEMTTVSRSEVHGDGQRCRRRVGIGRQVFRSHIVQTSEHMDANSEPNPVDNVQPVTSVADFNQSINQSGEFL